MGADTTADKVQDSGKDAHFLQTELIEDFFVPEHFSLFICTCVKHNKVIVNY